MRAGVQAAGDLTPREKILLADYSEVCKSHDAITDFRAKLLALLPLASGAGIGVLVTRKGGDVSPTEAGLLLALGLFGAVVTAGLFLYELRQIDLCKQLRNHAAWIENELGIESGQFGGRRGRLSLRYIYGPRAKREREAELGSLELAGGRGGSAGAPGGLWRKPFVGAEAAGYVVYHAAILGWLLLAVYGLVKLV